MPYNTGELNEQESQIPDLIKWKESRDQRELYLSKIEELDNLEASMEELKDNINEKKDRVLSLQSDIRHDSDNISVTVEKKRQEKVEELVVEGTINLHATKRLMTEELSKANKAKSDALVNISNEINKKKEGALDDLQKEIDVNINTINDASTNMLGERLSRLIDNSLDRNKISLKYTNLDDINERLQYLNTEAVNLDVSAAADIDGTIKGLTKKLNFKAEGKIAILYLILSCVVIYFFYKLVFPVIFLGLVFLSYLYIRNTSRLYSVKLETKSIEDNMEEVTEARNRELERVADRDRQEVENRHNPRIFQYESNLQGIDIEIRNEEDRIRREANPDTSQVFNTLQDKIDGKKDEASKLEKSIKELGVEHNKSLLLHKELVDSIDSVVDKTWKSYYNFSMDGEDNKPKPVTTILPEKIPMSIFRDGDHQEKGIDYFTIPRTNALFIYTKKDYNRVLEWAFRFMSGVVANTKLSSILIDVNEPTYNASEFRPLDFIDVCFRTSATKFSYEDFCKSNLSLIEERSMDYSKKEKGIDGFNWDSLLIEAPTLPYKFLFNFDESKVKDNIVNNDSGSSLADIGVYTYNFISSEALADDKYEDILHTLNKYEGTEYSGDRYNTVFSLAGENATPLPTSVAKRNLDSKKARRSR